MVRLFQLNLSEIKFGAEQVRFLLERERIKQPTDLQRLIGQAFIVDAKERKDITVSIAPSNACT